MKKIIEHFKNCPNRELIDCRITSFRDILSFNDIYIESYSLYILSSALAFVFGQVKPNSETNINLWLAGASEFNIEDNLFQNISLPFKPLAIENDDEGFHKITDYVDKDIPLLFVLESSHILGKNTYDISKPQDYLNVHNLTLTVLAGYSSDENIVYLDLKDSDSSELYATDIESFMKSRNSNCFPVSPANKCYLLDIDEDYRNWFKSNKGLLFKQSLIKTCNNMLMPMDSRFPNSDSRVIEFDKGILAMKRLIEVLKEFRINIQDANIDPRIADKIFNLKFAALRDGLLPGSNTCYREEFGRGIINAAELFCRSKQLVKIGEKFVDISKEWRGFIRLLYNAPYFLGKKDKYIKDVIKALEKLTDSEYLIFKKLLEFLKN